MLGFLHYTYTAVNKFYQEKTTQLKTLNIEAKLKGNHNYFVKAENGVKLKLDNPHKVVKTKKEIILKINW